MLVNETYKRHLYPYFIYKQTLGQNSVILKMNHDNTILQTRGDLTEDASSFIREDVAESHEQKYDPNK